MRMQSFFLKVLFLLLLSNIIFAQHIYVGIGGGYAYLDNNIYYTKDVEEIPGSGGLGLKNWCIFNSKIKYKSSQTAVIFTGEFRFISASRDIDYLGYYSLFQSSPAKMHLDASQDIYSFGIGIENPITLSPVTP
jgi:hypothetical protein